MGSRVAAGDDANTEAGDGCSDVCVVEDGYACINEPSECDTVWDNRADVLQPASQIDGLAVCGLANHLEALHVVAADVGAAFGGSSARTLSKVRRQ